MAAGMDMAAGELSKRPIPPALNGCDEQQNGDLPRRPASNAARGNFEPPEQRSRSLQIANAGRYAVRTPQTPRGIAPTTPSGGPVGGRTTPSDARRPIQPALSPRPSNLQRASEGMRPSLASVAAEVLAGNGVGRSTSSCQPHVFRRRTTKQNRSISVHASARPSTATTDDAHTPTPRAMVRTTEMVNKCGSCEAWFDPDSDAKYCFGCGSRRLETAQLENAFQLIVGMRSVMRKTDLTKFARQLKGAFDKAAMGKGQSIRQIFVGSQTAFDATLEEQLKQGVRCSQGIIFEHFHDFLSTAARSLDLTLCSLLQGLQVNAEGQRPEDEESGAAGGSNLPEIRRALKTSSTKTGSLFASESCENCGSKYISNAKFCRECGEKQTDAHFLDPNAFHAFEGTRMRLSNKATSSILADSDFDQVVRLAKKLHVPIEDIRQKQQDFLALDKDRSGHLSISEFKEAVRQQCNLPAGFDLPSHLVDANWEKATEATKGHLDFEAFVQWSYNTEFSEEVMVTNPQERHLRQLARTHGLASLDVDHIKEIFDRFDEQKNGWLCQGDFRRAMYALLCANKADEIPQSVIQRCWREIDTDGSGTITFDEFLSWFVTSVQGNVDTW